MTQGGAAPWDLAGFSNVFDLIAATRPQPQDSIPTGSADPSVERASGSAPSAEPRAGSSQPANPAETLLSELTRAGEGADKIARGALRAHHEVGSILEDPVGRRALDRLLITAQTVRENPQLKESFAVYITPDGRKARIDVTQGDRVFSPDAINQVQTIRERLDDYLGEYQGVQVHALIAGANAESADIRSLTRADQVQSWFVVPIGVFIVLLLALRDPWSCFNLVATMVLTYAFSLGATHLLFVNVLGAPGLDWKVPYFLFVLLVAVGVDYNVFLMSRVHEEVESLGVRSGITRAVSQTGGLITSAAMITACSFASFLSSPLGSIRQLGFALVVGILIDAVLVRPILVPCGQWMITRDKKRKTRLGVSSAPAMPAELATVGR